MLLSRSRLIVPRLIWSELENFVLPSLWGQVRQKERHISMPTTFLCITVRVNPWPGLVGSTKTRGQSTPHPTRWEINLLLALYEVKIF